MKIKCPCGNLIPDISDMHSTKAHFIPDELWLKHWDTIDEGLESYPSTPKEVDEASMKIRMKRFFNTAWQCWECGRLIIED